MHHMWSNRFGPKKDVFEVVTSNLVFLAWNCPAVLKGGGCSLSLSELISLQVCTIWFFWSAASENYFRRHAALFNQISINLSPDTILQPLLPCCSSAEILVGQKHYITWHNIAMLIISRNLSIWTKILYIIWHIATVMLLRCSSSAGILPCYALSSIHQLSLGLHNLSQLWSEWRIFLSNQIDRGREPFEIKWSTSP